MLQIVGSLYMLAALATAVDTPENAGGPLVIALAVVPVAFVCEALISGHPQVPTATLRATGLWLLVTLTVFFVHPIAALCAGYGVGAASALRSDREHPWKPRIVAVAVMTVYVAVLSYVAIGAGVLTGAAAPALAVKAGDMWAARADERAGSAGG